MEEIVKIIAENGIGIGSFIFMVYFVLTYNKQTSAIMEKISNTLVQIQISMATMTYRIYKIEEKINRKED